MHLSAARPFQFPPGMDLPHRVEYCLTIINKYRQELPALRTGITILKRQKSRAEEDAAYWKEQYKKEKQENEQLHKEIGKLKQEIAKLTRTTRRYQVSLFDHGNFKSPTDEEKKKKGGQLGHADTNREATEDYQSYQRQRLFAKECGKCHASLSRASSTRQKILLDIVINPEIVKLIVESERQWCGRCKLEVNARDARSLPFTEYGINTFLMVMILRFKSHASMGNIATVIALSHGLKLSKSDVSNLLKQAKRYLRSRYDQLIEAIRKGNVMYNDETGWLVNGQKAWLWIMANEEATIYFAAESRGKGIAEELYGNSQAHSMHDGFGSYTKTIPPDKQLYCWSHFLRFCFEETVTENKDSPAILLREELVAIYHIKKHHPEYSLAKLKHVLMKRLNTILTIASTNAAILAIQHRLKEQKEGLINSLLYTEDGTNNLAERELRPMVINKHISNGSNTFAGMETSAILGSIMQTISRKKETDFLPALTGYLHYGLRERYRQYTHIPQYDTS